MPLWAKVDVDMPADPKLFGQPIATRWLWLCLITLAKQQNDAGAVRGYDRALLAGRFNVPRKGVADALTHFQSARMVELDPDGTIRLLNFVKRQGPEDTSNERAGRYYDSHRETIREKRRVSRQQSHAVLTAVSRETFSLEVEQNRTEQKKEQDPLPSSAAPAPPPAPITELESDWPKDLLSRVKEAITSTRQSGSMAEGPWRSFLLSAKQFTPEIRAKASSEYLDRACATEGKGESYLIGIMRGETKRRAAVKTAPVSLHVDNEKLRAEPSGRKML